MDSMDDFERRLARMMHASEQHTPFEPRHRERLRDGVVVRRRVRTAWQAGSSAVAVTAVACALVLLPGSSSGQVVPAGPGGPATSGAAYPSTSAPAGPSAGGGASSSPTFSPSGADTGGTPTAPTGSADPSTATASVADTATSSSTATATSTDTGTASGGPGSTTSPPVSPYGNSTGTG
ncbi:cellulase [Streptomyces sp. MI02-7b]|uniref:cellulase n=1 Tax=Streptomyces sp. MI02-7b TaxID=462941 RepID=UPI0029A430FF|nr:cellulase [Streptomyces sp. MI02-7b]MDX3073658.1 cellulase [Streptomyces sp. MI02-7b]